MKYNAVFKGERSGGAFIGREVKNREVEVKVTTFKIDTD